MAPVAIKNPHLILPLATIGLLALCRVIFLKWFLSIIAFFAILMAVYINEKLEKQQQVEVSIQFQPHPELDTTAEIDCDVDRG